MATITEREATHTAPAPPATVSAGWKPANPAPLGLAAFAATTLMLSFVNSNLVGSGAEPVMLGVALAYGGIVQLCAGMWEFRNGNTFGAVAFSSFGGFWISFYLLLHGDAALISKTEVNAALGLYLWIWAVLSAGLLLCTFRSARALSALFAFLTATFAFLAIGAAGASAGATHVGGYLGIITGAIALYIAVADIMEEVYGRAVLPVGKPKG